MATAFQHIRTGLAFRGIPQDRQVHVRIGPEGMPVVQWPGELDLPALQSPAVARNWSVVMDVPERPFALPPRVDAVANLCASPEHYSASLAALDNALPPGLPVLNHPRAVFWTRRDLAAGHLAQVPGLKVPSLRRFRPQAPRDFMAAFEESGFRYPVLLQPAAAEEGLERHEITHPGGWTRIFRTAWAGRVWIMTQVAPGRSPWRLRVGMAGQAVHAEVFLDGAVPVGQPPTLDVNVLRPLLGAVRQCMPLDCATLVLVLEPGGPVLERIVAGLPVPLTDASPPELGQVAHNVRAALAGPLAAVLKSPAQWRKDATHFPAIAGPSGTPAEVG